MQRILHNIIGMRLSACPIQIVLNGAHFNLAPFENC